MPIYEFICNKCRHEYEAIVARAGESAPCPECGGKKADRLISRPAPPRTDPTPATCENPCMPGG